MAKELVAANCSVIAHHLEQKLVVHEVLGPHHVNVL